MSFLGKNRPALHANLLAIALQLEYQPCWPPSIPPQFPDFPAWFGYLAALIEWQLISVEQHRKLVELLPPLDPNPAIKILLGYSSQRAQAKLSKNSQN
jgi:hypothetical protein